MFKTPAAIKFRLPALRLSCWLLGPLHAALLVAIAIAFGSTPGCNCASSDDNVSSQPILDIQKDALPGGVAVRIQVHGKAAADWCLGVRRSDGTFEHGAEARSTDCAGLHLDDQGNGQYSLAVLDPMTDSLLLVELSPSCGIEAGSVGDGGGVDDAHTIDDGGRLADAGPVDGGRSLNEASGGPICAGSSPLRSMVWPLGSTPIDGGDIDANARVDSNSPAGPQDSGISDAGISDEGGGSQ